jgi:ferredoxin-NADP reductase
MQRKRKAELVSARMLSPSVRSLIFRTADGLAVGHVPGQYLDLVVPTSHGFPFRRAYSIASAPDAARPDTFEIAVTRVEGGPTSEALHTAAPGLTIEIDGPHGTFVRRKDDRAFPALFVATGTGLAPIRAMLAEEVPILHGPPMALLFGCRTRRDVLWGDELREWERTCARLRLHITLSRPPPEWSGLMGYVQRHALRLANDLPGVQAYVCGLSAMVDEVVNLLRTGGVSRESLRYETYD